MPLAARAVEVFVDEGRAILERPVQEVLDAGISCGLARHVPLVWQDIAAEPGERCVLLDTRSMAP